MIAAAIRKVWASAYLPRAVAYLAHAGLRPPQLWRGTGYLERELQHVDTIIAMSEFFVAARGVQDVLRKTRDRLAILGIAQADEALAAHLKEKYGVRVELSHREQPELNK